VTKKLRLAFVTSYNPLDVRNWSGLPYHMAEALKAHFDVRYVRTFRGLNGHLHSAWRRLFEKFSPGEHHLDRDPIRLRKLASILHRELESTSADVVFSPGTLPIACVAVDRPIVFWTDATFASLLGFYPEFSNLAQATVSSGNAVEQLALQRAALALYSSTWAANSAHHHYDTSRTNVHMVPFGPNIAAPGPATVRAAIKSRDMKVCRLLFIGVDWLRKGGPMALEIARRLAETGTPVELAVVGPHRLSAKMPHYVSQYGYLDKTTPSDVALMHRLLLQSHFLLLPSRADCTPIAIPEAFAHGVPCISSDVGGLPELIDNGRTGWVLSVNSGPDAYASAVEALFTMNARYAEVAWEARLEFEQRLNWRKSAHRVADLVAAIRGD
jgi:glycosyltransferase involved in cell wall biosynthesis